MATPAEEAIFAADATSPPVVTSTENEDLEAWKQVHAALLQAVFKAQDAVDAAKAQRRYWMEEVCANLTPDGKLKPTSVWKRPVPLPKNKPAAAAASASTVRRSVSAGTKRKKKEPKSSAPASGTGTSSGKPPPKKRKSKTEKPEGTSPDKAKKLKLQKPPPGAAPSGQPSPAVRMPRRHEDVMMMDASEGSSAASRSARPAFHRESSAPSYGAAPSVMSPGVARGSSGGHQPSWSSSAAAMTNPLQIMVGSVVVSALAIIVE